MRVLVVCCFGIPFNVITENDVSIYSVDDFIAVLCGLYW